MNKKSKLLVLGVAINEYGVKEHQLKGCHNDLDGLIDFLNKHIDQKSWNLKICELRDQKATRQGLIETFLSFFGNLKDGDSALFYFSGHGSQAYAPKVFRHEMQGKLHETIVCYDSRTNSRDLYDKEMSYLIWKITQKKKVHFTVIMDCCHAESITKDGKKRNKNGKERIRRTAKQKTKFSWKDYLGADSYLKTDKGLKVPVGNHILMAACRRNEKSKERNLEFKQRGVFTYGLLKTLEKSKGNITYGALLNRIQSIVYNFTIDQHPQLEAHGIDNPWQKYFLGGSIQQQKELGLVSYHYSKGWILNMGSINGLSNVVFGASIVKLDLSESSKIQKDSKRWNSVLLEKIHPTYSTVRMPKTIDNSKRFSAIIPQSNISKLPVSVAPDSDAEGLNLFVKEWKKNKFKYFYLCNSLEQAAYLIHIEKGRYSIQALKTNFCFLQTLNGYSKTNAKLLVQSLDKIARWHQIKALENPTSLIHDLTIKLTFYEVIKINSTRLEVLKERQIPDFTRISPKLKYRFNTISKKWEEPAFRLRFENPASNKQPIWIALLFLGSDFSITNELCPLKMLAPGDVYFLEAIDPSIGYYTNIIPLHLEEEYIRNGITTLTEHFKILIATEEFNTYNLNQHGIALFSTLKDKKKKFYRGNSSKKTKIIGWKSIDFSVQITASLQ